jgi:hypothetical protein
MGPGRLKTCGVLYTVPGAIVGHWLRQAGVLRGPAPNIARCVNH